MIPGFRICGYPFQLVDIGHMRKQIAVCTIVDWSNNCLLHWLYGDYNKVKFSK